MRACRFDVDRVQRLACSHEQSIPLGAAETNVRTGLRDADHSDAIAIGRNYLNARARAGPDISVHIAANSIGSGRLAGAGNIELHEAFSVTDGFAVDIPHSDLAWRASVGHIELPVIRRKTNSIRPTQFI